MIVVDTNIVAYLFLSSPMSHLAEKLRHHEPHWVAPRVWRSEMRNVLAHYRRRSMLTHVQALMIQDRAERLLREREYELPSMAVLELVDQSDCSAYDCEFVALARIFRINLITADKKLATSFPDVAVLLNDFT